MDKVASALDRTGAPTTDRLMSIDSAGYRYAAGRPGVVLVNDPIETIREVAQAYDIDWLILERDDGVAAVGPILDGDVPDWLAPPIVIQPGKAGGSTVDAGLYRVRRDGSAVAP
jgi:hypothetical protein